MSVVVAVAGLLFVVGRAQGRSLVNQVRMLSLLLLVGAGVRMSFDRLDDVLFAADGHIARLTMSSKVANINKRGENKNRSRKLDHHHSFKGKKKNKKFWFLFSFLIVSLLGRQQKNLDRPVGQPKRRKKNYESIRLRSYTTT